MRAVKEEAPRDSRPSQLSWRGRNMHFMSVPEREGFLIAAFHGDLLEVWEQYVLPVQPTPHFLMNAPFFAGGQKLRMYQGTLHISEALGLMKHHPTISHGGSIIPFPWLGDLLLFLRGESHPFVINWSIKNSLIDFERPYQAKARARNPERAAERERARHAVEEALHLDVGIRTIRVTPQAYPRKLVVNLEWAYLWSTHATKLSEETKSRVLQAFQDGMQREDPMVSVSNLLTRRTKLTPQQIKASLGEHIFKKRLLVDLENERLQMDLPLRPRVRDPLAHLEHWFTGGN